MIINEKTKNGLSKFSLVFDGAVCIEDENTYGISHLSEHLLCKALDDYQDEFDINSIDFNAYTSTTHIEFYIAGLDEDILKYRDIFIEKLLNYKVSKEDFEKEKSIILEEYNEYYSDLGYAHFYQLYRIEDGYYSALGDINVIKNITYEQYLEFHHKLYDKPSKIINIASIDYVNDKLEFSSNVNKVYTKSNKELECFNLINNRDLVSIIGRTDIIDIKHVSYCNFINYMLSYGLNSPLMKEIREDKGFTYDVSSCTDDIGNYFRNVICLTTNKNNISQVIDSINNILDKELTEERFEIIKNNRIKYYKMKNIINAPSTTKYVYDNYQLLEDIINEITFDDIKKYYADYFKDFKYSIYDGELKFL